MNPRSAYWLLALVVLLWGANWPTMKVALEHITPLWFTVARMQTGAAWAYLLTYGLAGSTTVFPPLAATGLAVGLAFGLGAAINRHSRKQVDHNKTEIDERQLAEGS